MTSIDSVTLEVPRPNGRRALAKDAGVSPEGTGSHRIVIGSDTGPFTDPDGFAWEAANSMISTSLTRAALNGGDSNGG
jgi:hypothetical protein